MKRTKRSRPAKARRPPRKRPAPPAKPARPSAAETALLALARALTSMADAEPSPRDAVLSTLEVLGNAFAAGAPLPRTLGEARQAAREDAARALALAWAREQLRMSLGEILDRAAIAGDVHPSLPAPSLAWLVLAACEALADEPHEAAADRLKLLVDWLTGPGAAD